PAPPAFYSLSLHDALPIFGGAVPALWRCAADLPRRASNSLAARRGPLVATRLQRTAAGVAAPEPPVGTGGKARRQDHLQRLRRRSEEHTSELQSLAYLVCR